MKNKVHTVRIPKTDKNQVSIKVDLAHLPSKECKYAALKHKSAVFADKRLKKPKYKQTDTFGY